MPLAKEGVERKETGLEGSALNPSAVVGYEAL